MARTLVISGGSSGIGKATASLFAERGWRVFELSRHGADDKTITHVDCDVCDTASVKAAVAEVLKKTETIDVVISNAGFGISGAVEFTGGAIGAPDPAGVERRRQAVQEQDPVARHIVDQVEQAALHAAEEAREQAVQRGKVRPVVHAE